LAKAICFSFILSVGLGLAALFLERGVRVLWQILWIWMIPRCCEAGIRFFSFLVLGVGSLIRCFLARLKVFWVMVHFFLVYFFFGVILGRRVLASMTQHMPQGGLRDLILLPKFLKGNPKFFFRVKMFLAPHGTVSVRDHLLIVTALKKWKLAPGHVWLFCC
jgi:hypothetical protein